MVSSGAIAEGMKRLGWTTRPHDVHELQAAAAVGQMGLAQIYENGAALARHRQARRCSSRMPTSPTVSAISMPARRSSRCSGLGVVPVINENNTVVTGEIKFGDNDTLGALVANLSMPTHW